jgi:hypothetical protein
MPVCDLCSGFSLTGNVCASCGLKKPPEQLIQANSINLQVSTVAAMVGRFEVENHQAKHYAGGDRSYAHFDAKDGSTFSWREVHQLIIYCVTQILTVQKAKGLIKPCNGYVQFAGMRENLQWYAGRNKGYTDTVMVQLTVSLKDGFSGHGYPLDNKRVNALGKDPNLTTGTYGAWEGIQLSGDNNNMKILRHGT